MELNIADLCDAIAEQYPDRVCLEFRDRRFTWSEIARRTDAFAAALTAVALGRRRPFAGSTGWESTQEHVALYLHNGNEYLEGMLGAYKAVWAPVNINYRYKSAELTYVLADSRSRVLVFHSRFAPLVDEVRAALPDLELLLQVDDDSGEALLDGARWYEDVIAELADDEVARERVASIERSGDDLYVCYTGGTTGMPKGVLWRQADFVVSALGLRHRDGSDFDSVAEIVELAGSSTLRALPAPPLMHGAAHWNAISCWLAGGTIVIQSVPEHFDAADILDTIERHSVSSLLIVGDSFAAPLLDEITAREAAGDPADLSSLRHLLSGGAVLSPHMKATLLERITGLTIVDVLGSSESGRQGVATVRRPGDVGASGFRTERTADLLSEALDRTLDADDAADVGVDGWLSQTGRVPLGYLGDETKTRATFPVIDGVRYAVAGDRARYRPDGSLELLGRESVCINTGGEKVFAEEVEVALTSHPAVLDAIVCGRPSERWGNEIVGVVAMRSGDEPDDRELIDHVKAQLASYKAPKVIIRVEAVVRSPSGKPDYSWARSVAEQH